LPSQHPTSPLALFGDAKTPVRTIATLALLSGLIACDETEQSCDGGTEAPSDIKPCDDQQRCARGLECVPRPPNRACVSMRPAPHCTVPHEQDDATTRLLLVHGFEVSAVQLRRVDTEKTSFARFSWEPPKGASIAVCSLFGCAPTFERRRITNVAECLLRQWWSKPVPAMLDLRDLRDAVPAATRSPLELRYGCWIFSEVLLIAATPLERLALNDVPDSRKFVVECSESTSEGQSCVLAGQTMLFGRCASRRCARSCVRDEDCEDSNALAIIDAGVRDAGRTSTHGHCDHREHELGVCSTSSVQGDP